VTEILLWLDHDIAWFGAFLRRLYFRRFFEIVVDNPSAIFG
jgi:hypothetical protein